MKLCKDCKWCRPTALGWTRWVCESPRRAQVLGNKLAMLIEGPAARTNTWPFCEQQREDRRPMCWLMGTCGRHARWFEPKEQSDA